MDVQIMSCNSFKEENLELRLSCNEILAVKVGKREKQN